MIKKEKGVKKVKRKEKKKEKRKRKEIMLLKVRKGSDEERRR